MFTEMRNVLKEDENTSKVTTKSLSDPDVKPQQENKGKKIDQLKKTNSKLKTLKKEQEKLKKNVETDVNAIRNIFCHLGEVLKNSQPEKEKEPEPEPSTSTSCETQFLREILEEAVSVEKQCH